MHLTQGYSCTEVLGAFVMDIDGDAPHGAAGRVYPDERLANGPVVRVVDDDLRPVAAGERGEIQFHRRFAMARYWGAPEATEDAFVGGDWYATGDIGSVDQDGFLAVLDRKKDVIIRGGFNIYSAEIERVLTQHPGVAESAVVGRPDLALGEVPVAFVVPTDASVSAELLHQYVRGRLGRLKEPATIELVAYDELPRNGLGKVIKAQLRARLATTSG